MVDKGSGRGRGRGGSSSAARPFYELPSHMKPCSQIIQETRLQLKYSTSTNSSSSGGSRRDLSQPLPPPTATPTSMNGTAPSANWGDVDYGLGSMRPVNTKRPFTPRDSASLWGVSARKRPPSAITLSRLSMPIEDVGDSSRPGSRGGGGSSPSHTFGNVSGSLTSGMGVGGGKGRLSRGSGGGGPEARNSLGSLSSHSGSGSLAGIAESDGDEEESISTRNHRGGRSSAGENGGEEKVEKARLEIKSLSLQNVTSPPWSALGEIGTKAEKNWRHSDLDPEARGDVANGVGDTDPYQNITNLEVALEYLHSFVMEYHSDKPPRVGDVVSILKRIRGTLSASGDKGSATSSGVGDGWGDDSGISSKLRKTLLELIFKLVEKNQNDANILFWSSFVLLHCNIIGNNLTTVFKMVFKSSKSKDYKDVILGTEYLEILMKSFSQICPKTQTESMIYGYGTLKFLCGDTIVLNRLVDLNLIPIMALHLKILNCEIELSQSQGQGQGQGQVPEGILNGTFQLTSILRSVVGENRTLIPVVQSGLLSQLITTLAWALSDVDVLTNIVRILSVVSMDGVCCLEMVKNASFYPPVVRVLSQWYDKEDVIVRVAFCLGNLLANSDDMRINLFEETSAFQGVLRVMTHYLEKSPPTPASIDILIKTTRVIANWILNPFVGSEICDDPTLSEVLYSTLQSAGGVAATSSQELSLCVMCALNNTSFYINYTQLDEGTLHTAEYLFQTLPKQDVEVRTESVKVLGNLTRNQDVRLMSANYMENILHCLDGGPGESAELLCATCGVLINVVIESLVKEAFFRGRGVERVISVLERSDDIMVSLITCQVLWNLCISHENQGLGDITDCISPEDSAPLKSILEEKVEKVTLNLGLNLGRSECDIHPGSGSCNCFSNLELITQDFLQVAKDLVAKL